MEGRNWKATIPKGSRRSSFLPFCERHRGWTCPLIQKPQSRAFSGICRAEQQVWSMAGSMFASAVAAARWLSALKRLWSVSSVIVCYSRTKPQNQQARRCTHGTDQTRRPWRGQASSSRLGSCWRCWRPSARRSLRRAMSREVSAVGWNVCVCAARGASLHSKPNGFTIPTARPAPSSRSCVCVRPWGAPLHSKLTESLFQNAHPKSHSPRARTSELHRRQKTSVRPQDDDDGLPPDRDPYGSRRPPPAAAAPVWRELRRGGRLLLHGRRDRARHRGPALAPVLHPDGRGHVHLARHRLQPVHRRAALRAPEQMMI